MTRAFVDELIEPELIDDLIDTARRSPSAGNTSAMQYLVLEGPGPVAAYWEVTLAPEKRDTFPWPGLLTAPCIIVPFVEPAAYPERYAEADKAHTGLGAGQNAWTTPYWWVDGGMAAMTLLLGIEAVGLGALFFGVFEHEPAVRDRFGIPAQMRAIGAIALGRPADDQRPSSSSGRSRAPLSDVVHRGRWVR